MSGERTLFVIGAGCSRNFDTSTNGISDLSCPTNSDFFRMARIALMHSTIERYSQTMIKELFIRLCEERGLHFDARYEFLKDTTFNDLEEVMSLIDIEDSLFGKRAMVRNYNESYKILIELIAFTITRALDGPECPLHKQLASLIKNDDVIIDFNYDLLMDEALKSAGKLNDFGYGINFSYIYDNDWKRPEGDQLDVNFFKLHGSLNWFKCMECASIFLFKNFHFPLHIFNLNYSAENLDCPICESGGESLIRLVLPPIQTKEYSIDPFRLLWRRGANKLKEITRIAFLGYSFGTTDFAMRGLLRSLNAKNKISDMDIRFMNKTSKAEERFKLIFPKIRTPTRTTNLKEFIEKYPSWS